MLQSILFLIVPVILFGAYKLMNRVPAKATAQAVDKQIIKTYLLRANQLMTLLIGFGLAASVPFLQPIADAISFANLEFENVATAVLLLIDFGTGLAAFFITKEIDEGGAVVTVSKETSAEGQSASSSSVRVYAMKKLNIAA